MRPRSVPLEYSKRAAKMNIHDYYRLIKQQEQSISTEYVWITSLGVRNGGVAGRVCEVARSTAARLIVEGASRLATDSEAREEQARQESKLRRAAESVSTSFVVASSEN